MTRFAFISLWLLVFTIPWQNAIVIPEFGTVTRGVGALLVGFTILSVVRVGRLRPFSLIQALMTLFLGWAVITSAWTIDPVNTPDRVITYLQLLIMVWAIWQLTPTPDKQQSLIKAFVLGAAIPSILMIATRLSGSTGESGRYQAANMGINELGYTFVMALAMSCYLAATERKSWLFWCYTALMGVFQVGVLLTASRGAALASAVAWMFLPWVFARLKAYKKSATIILACALLVSVIALVPAASWQRLAETGQEIESGSFSRRGPIWLAGWEAFQKDPFFGVGVGAFQMSVLGKVPGQVRSPHNVFLSVGVELGLVGLALLLGTLVCLAVGCLQLPRFDRRLGLILLTTWMMTAMAANFEYKKTTWFVFALLAAQVGGRIRLGMPVRRSPAAAAASERGYAY